MQGNNGSEGTLPSAPKPIDAAPKLYSPTTGAGKKTTEDDLHHLCRCDCGGKMTTQAVLQASADANTYLCETCDTVKIVPFLLMIDDCTCLPTIRREDGCGDPLVGCFAKGGCSSLGVITVNNLRGVNRMMRETARKRKHRQTQEEAHAEPLWLPTRDGDGDRKPAAK